MNANYKELLIHWLTVFFLPALKKEKGSVQEVIRLRHELVFKGKVPRPKYIEETSNKLA